MILNSKKILITGGLGFIGSNFVRFLISQKYDGNIILFDNNSIDNQISINEFRTYKNISIVFGDLLLEEPLYEALQNVQLVIHLAANSDISKGVNNPKIDFKNTVVATNNLLCAMLHNNVKKIIFSSGSGVYGDIPNIDIPEDYGQCMPVSHYGASKLCAESMISAFVHMHEFQALIFRFANVIGIGQTHGVAYDFIKRIRNNSETLEIKGDGNQQKSYIHITDVINGIMMTAKNYKGNIDYYNISTDDLITVKEIAEIVRDKMKVKDLKFSFGNTPYGWKGDVPKITLSNLKLKSLGWLPLMSTRLSIEKSIDEMLNENVINIL